MHSWKTLYLISFPECCHQLCIIKSTTKYTPKFLILSKKGASKTKRNWQTQIMKWQTKVVLPFNIWNIQWWKAYHQEYQKKTLMPWLKTNVHLIQTWISIRIQWIYNQTRIFQSSCISWKENTLSLKSKYSWILWIYESKYRSLDLNAEKTENDQNLKNQCQIKTVWTWYAGKNK